MSGLGRRITQIAGHQCCDQLLERHDDRTVIGRDGDDDTNRLVSPKAERHSAPHQLIGRDWVRLLVRQGQIEIDGVASKHQPSRVLSELREQNGLPGLSHHRCHQGLVHRFEVVQEEAKDASPLWCREVRPDALIERATGFGNGSAHLIERGSGELGDQRLVGRVFDGKDFITLNPPSGNEGASLFEDPPVSHATHLEERCRA